MAATITHMALAGLLAAALLGEVYDRKSVAVVLVAVALPDLDSFLALWIPWAHRALLHTLLLPVAAALLLFYDLRIRDRSFVRSRWGYRGVRVAWVSILCVAVAQVMLDLVTGVVNPFWPLYDQFYALDGKIELSDQRGIIQTFVEFPDPEGNGGGVPVPEGSGSTAEVAPTTGVEPDPRDVKEDPERVFPVVRSGAELLLLVVGTAVTWARFHVSQRVPDAE